MALHRFDLEHVTLRIFAWSICDAELFTGMEVAVMDFKSRNHDPSSTNCGLGRLKLKTLPPYRHFAFLCAAGQLADWLACETVRLISETTGQKKMKKYMCT